MREKVRNTKISIWTFVVIVIAAVGGVTYMPNIIKVSSNVNGRELPIAKVKTLEKEIALTFDLTWGSENIKEVLNILEAHHVRATFFLSGNWVETYPEFVETIIEAGHDIGNHSLTHSNMTQQSFEEKIAEIQGVHDNVKELTGYEMILFRAPYGAYDDEVILAAKELGYSTVNWSVDSFDWKDYGKDSIIDTVLQNKELEEGAIIRMHAEAKYTKDALESVILGIKEKGLEFVPLSELIYTEDYFMEVDGTQVKK